MKVGEFKKNFRRRANVWIPRQAKKTVGGKRTGPNATEARYLREIINPSFNDGKHIISYEPAPFYLTAATKREYTADFLVQNPSCISSTRPTYHEVKGSYHLPTHERARLAWEIAAEQNPQYDFVWAELTRSGWEIERWEAGGKRILVHLAGEPAGRFKQADADWRRHKPRKRSARNRKA